MKRFLLLSVLIVSFFGASAQRYFYSRATLGGASAYQQILMTDVPSNFLRSNATNTLTGDMSIIGNDVFNIQFGNNSGGRIANLEFYLGGIFFDLDRTDTNFQIDSRGNAAIDFEGHSSWESTNGWQISAAYPVVRLDSVSGITWAGDYANLNTDTFNISRLNRWSFGGLAGSDGDVLTQTASGMPRWEPASGGVSNQNAFTGYLARIPQQYNDVAAPAFRSLNNSDLPIRNGYKVRLTGIPIFFGDSFTTGTGASPGTFAWVEQFKTANGNITINNQAVGARGVNTAALAAYAQMPTFMNGSTAILMVGFNDGGRNGAASGTLNKINNVHRAIAANTWLKFAIAASAATNTGTWSNYTAQTLKASNLGGNTRQSSTSGDLISYTTTEASDNIVVFCLGTDGVTYDHGRFTVTIDGTVMATYNPNGQTDGVTDGSADNGRVPNALVFNGLRNSTHTVVLTLLDSKTTVIDAIGYMMKPEESAGVIVSSIPRRNAAGYASGSATDATVTTTNASLEADLELSFPFRPWVFVRQERSFDTANDIDADNIHPDNSGHTHLFQNMQNAVRENGNVTSTLRFFPHTTTGPSAYWSNAGMGMSLFHNTNPATNAVMDAASGSSIFQSNVTAGAGNTALTYFASASGGGNPSQRWKMDNTGKHTWSNMTDGTFLDATSGSISHMAVGNMEVLAGASKNSAGQYTAKLTAASVLNVSPGSGMVLFSNPSGLTIGNTYSPTEIGRIGSTIVRFSANTLIGNNSSSPNSTLHVEGSMANAYVARTTALTLGATHYLVEVTSGTHTQTLPTAVGITGRTYVITNSGSGTVTVGTTSSQTFVNVSGTPTTLTLNQFQTVTVMSNGANWLRISTL